MRTNHIQQGEILLFSYYQKLIEIELPVVQLNSAYKTDGNN